MLMPSNLQTSKALLQLEDIEVISRNSDPLKQEKFVHFYDWSGYGISIFERNNEYKFSILCPNGVIFISKRWLVDNQSAKTAIAALKRCNLIAPPIPIHLIEEYSKYTS